MIRLHKKIAVLAIAAAALGVVGTQPATATFKPRWTGTWATALTAPSAGNTANSLAGFNNQSLRMIVRTSVAGEKMRIRLSNEFGAQAIRVGHASVGIPSAPGSPELVPGSLRGLTFNGGDAGVTIFKGAEVISDPLDLAVPALSELAVTIFLPEATGQTSWHWQARQTSYVYAGDRAGDPSGAGPTNTFNSFYFLAGVDVASRTAHGTVVVLGDSISDGFGSPLNANQRWTDALATRIVNTYPHLGDPGVLNLALSGNFATHDAAAAINFAAAGLSGMARLDDDVYGQTGVRTVIVELGVNDIHFVNTAPDRVIAGLRQLAAQLKERGIRALVCTIGPFEGYTTWTPEKEATRTTVNAYLRAGTEFDYLIDMDAILRDPAQPTKLKPEFDSGDHIHPNAAGSEALANAIPLWQL
ncbi:SGNH/GDSL hydrolase family protein [Allorhizocola rhizosphaerae]|uniref:SGNH/GDSL hydrolase family protein n=1 Tax=Allorhizocola rhizosphaerae TaxID=1872709 RepID=UPI000E3ED570|nr:SGNH/GDSL hydrolase family protein [Allorhizocola rhizosphaerae]